MFEASLCCAERFIKREGARWSRTGCTYMRAREQANGNNVIVFINRDTATIFYVRIFKARLLAPVSTLPCPCTSFYCVAVSGHSLLDWISGHE